MDGTCRKQLDLSAIRARLKSDDAPRYWKSLEELAESNQDEWRSFLQQEFPQHTAQLQGPVNRREFLALMGASLAIAGLSGCSETPPAKILPYVRPPEELVPGKPLYFATAMPMAGYANPLIAESNMGRPTKVEGNPGHPASLGAASAFAQSSVLSLYDPDRSQVVATGGRISTWISFADVLTNSIAEIRTTKGAGLRFLTGAVTSPTLAWQFARLLEEFPLAKWHAYEPVARDNARAGARLAFGAYVDTQYRFDRANVILSLDSDFLSMTPGHVRYARDFAGRRKVQPGQNTMSRLYVLESTPSITGAMADHRFPMRAGDVENFAYSLALRLGVRGVESATKPLADPPWLDALVRDLKSNAGSCVVLAGDDQPASVHAMAHAMNDALGNNGKTVIYTDPVEASPLEHLKSLTELTADMDEGKVSLLAILGGNPVFNAPVDLQFHQALEKVRLRVHLGLFENETSRLCHWHIPEVHYLESWGDSCAYDGTVTIVQPLINPLYGGKTTSEFLSACAGQPGRPAYEIVRDYWKDRMGPDFEASWRRALHDGLVSGTAAAARNLTLASDFRIAPPSRPAVPQAAIELVFRPDPTIFDGSVANNAWLQELPKPLTKLTWDNAALISPQTAERLNLTNEDVIELRYDAHSLHAPVWISPGHAEDSITLHLGYGRTVGGSVGSGRGVNANEIRTTGAPFILARVDVRKTGQRMTLASTQSHHNMEGRDPVRVVEASVYSKDPGVVQSMEPAGREDISLYPERPPGDYAWGMSIDLSACIGCNACVVACQAENNIPVVGKTQVQNGREMHWIRIDTYFEGGLENPEAFFQPVPCMHCENAPCELVCPVGATTHSVEGLNEMTYNRCVGTRYCSNNCPYKVRRFNFLQYADYETSNMKLLNNPDVTVRSRGVMEKCTYCVQRINRARIEAEKEDRRIRDGEIVTACQATCPADAIVFGDTLDSQSRVAKLKQERRDYRLLGELNTRPRTTYLAKLTNPNPDLPKRTRHV
jgi:MoCo/4Fe-4S cofactor protein with predicted Tat translocation signal